MTDLVNHNQVIFDAIVAATSYDADGIIVSVKRFIETFNSHRDRALCTSLHVGPEPSSTDTERLRQVLGAFYKTVDVMKSARNRNVRMAVWADDMKAIEDVMLFLEELRDNGGAAQTPTTPPRPDSIYSQFHLDNWTDADFASHAAATRKTLEWLLRLEASGVAQAPLTVTDETVSRAIDAHVELFDSGDAVGAMRAALTAALNVAQTPAQLEELAQWADAAVELFPVHGEKFRQIAEVLRRLPPAD